MLLQPTFGLEFRQHPISISDHLGHSTANKTSHKKIALKIFKPKSTNLRIFSERRQARQLDMINSVEEWGKSVPVLLEEVRLLSAGMRLDALKQNKQINYRT